MQTSELLRTPDPALVSSFLKFLASLLPSDRAFATLWGPVFAHLYYESISAYTTSA
jgi:hypothetical protein